MLFLLGVPWIFSAFGAMENVHTGAQLEFLEGVCQVSQPSSCILDNRTTLRHFWTVVAQYTQYACIQETKYTLVYIFCWLVIIMKPASKLWCQYQTSSEGLAFLPVIVMYPAYLPHCMHRIGCGLRRWVQYSYVINVLVPVP